MVTTTIAAGKCEVLQSIQSEGFSPHETRCGCTALRSAEDTCRVQLITSEVKGKSGEDHGNYNVCSDKDMGEFH